MQPSCDDRYFQVIAPEFPLHRRDGVHLILIKKEEVTDPLRFELSRGDSPHAITMMVGRSMCDVLDFGA